MTIYRILIAMCIFGYMLCKTLNNKNLLVVADNKNIKSYFVIMSVFMIVMIGLRHTDIGIDTPGYYTTYRTMENKSFSYLLEDDINDKGYVFLQILGNRLGISFEAFNVIYAIFNISVISYLIYKTSPMPWLSYFLYIAFGFFVLDMTMMRQTLAMSIVILAVLRDKNKTLLNFVKFALLVYIAYTIHASAIICLPLWFVKKIPYDEKIVMVLFVLMAIAFIFKQQFAEFIFNIAGDISEKYENAEGLGEVNAGIKLYVMILASVGLGFLLKRFLSDKWNAFYFYCMCIMLIIFPAVQGGGAIMRIYFYFYIFMIVYVPDMINGINKEKDKAVYVLITVAYVILGLYMYNSSLTGNYYLIVPYKFFWQ